ncbi:transitional endoplasmic reticulum ATPase-like [Saccoglossus kowalevskii]
MDETDDDDEDLLDNLEMRLWLAMQVRYESERIRQIPEEYRQHIFEMERRPSSDLPTFNLRRFVVEDTISRDSSQVFMCQEKMKELGLISNDIVLLRSKNRRSTVCNVVADKTLELSKVRLNYHARKSLKVFLGGFVRVVPCRDIVNADRIHIIPYGNSKHRYTRRPLFDNYLKPYFNERHRPIHEKDVFMVNDMEFQVIHTDPSPYCIVTSNTEIYCDGQLPREVEDYYSLDRVGYDDIGGYTQPMREVRENMANALAPRGGVLGRMGATPTYGILLTGPSGSGKTMIGKSLANETDASIMFIDGPDIVSKCAEAGVSVLELVFIDAEKNQPSIVFIDAIDGLAGKDDIAHSDVQMKCASFLGTRMDRIHNNLSRVVVIGATENSSRLDPRLRRFGRFSKEILIGMPDTNDRLRILKIHTREMKLADDVELKQVAYDAHGYTGADLAGLCSEAAMHHLRKKMGLLHVQDKNDDATTINNLAITMKDFQYAMSKSGPSILRERVAQIPKISWQDIGGLEEVKKELREFVQYPINYPEQYAKFGLSPCRGMLLYGPPGCGKTLLAKAVANECRANFLSVGGPELMAMPFGHTAMDNVKDLYNKARLASPCILFFDEMDSISANREASGYSGADIIVNQLLMEMDGITTTSNVFVIGATNRPDLIDSAILRPGRLSQLIYIRLPDESSRYLILKAILRHSPVARDVNLKLLAVRTEGYSGADLACICKRAGQIAIRENIEAEKIREEWRAEQRRLRKKFIDACPITEISTRHFEEALRVVRRSVTDNDIKLYESFSQNLQKTMTFQRKKSSHELGLVRRIPNTDEDHLLIES